MVRSIANEADLDLVKQFLADKEASEVNALQEEADLQAEIALSSTPDGEFLALEDPGVIGRYQARARVFQVVVDAASPLSIREIAFGPTPKVQLGSKMEELYSLFVILEKLYSFEEAEALTLAGMRKKFERASQLRKLSRPKVVIGLVSSLLAVSIGTSLLIGSLVRGNNYAGATWDRENLSGRNLDGYVLSDAKLRAVKLQGSSLKRANLARAEIVSGDLGGANLTRADLRGANLRDASLRDADLTGANLSGANLHGADLTGATLNEATLVGADLTGAKLDLATVKKARVDGLKLKKSSLDQATLDDLDLSTVVGMAEAKVDGVKLGPGVTCPKSCKEWLQDLKASSTVKPEGQKAPAEQSGEGKPWIPKALQR